MDFCKVLVEQSPNAIAIFDREMKCILATKQWLDDYQLTRNEVEGMLLPDILPETDADWKKVHQLCIDGQKYVSEEIVLTLADGTTKWISLEACPWFAEDGIIGGIIVNSVIVNKHKALETQLRIQEQQFRGAFETSSIGMAIIGLDGQWIKVNDSLLKIFGYDRERLYQLTFQDITHPDDLAEDLKLLRDLANGERESYEMEKRYFNSKGQIVWVLLSVSIVHDAIGNPLHFISQLIDITESKRLAHLRLSEMDRKIDRIAFELHENIAQTLASIKLFLASSRAGKVYEGKDFMGIDRKLSSLISDIQLLTDQIVPTTFIGESLHSLISGLVIKYAFSSDIKIDLMIDEYLETMTLPSTYNIFRIVEDQIQSAVLRNASLLTLKIKKTKTLVITCVDNGRIEKYPSGSKVGLLINNIKTRVEMLDGILRKADDIYKKNSYSISIPLSSIQ